jgi:hypothetical protein
MRNETNTGRTPKRVYAICKAGLLMLSNSRRMSQEKTRHANNDDAVEPALPHDPRLLEFQKAPIQDGMMARMGLRWAKCVVCNHIQPDYKMEKGQCHDACICCGCAHLTEDAWHTTSKIIKQRRRKNTNKTALPLRSV